MALTVLPTQTDEAQAINRMLESIGERPVNDVETDQRLDVIKARNALNEAFVLALDRGWWFNSEPDVELSPNVAGEYVIPGEVLKVVPKYRADNKFSKRGAKLYDSTTRLFTGNTDNLFVSFVVGLEYNDCPESFKQYVARRAGVLFQKRAIGSPTLYEFTKEDEAEAFATLLQEEADQNRANLREAPDQIDLNFNR